MPDRLTIRPDKQKFNDNVIRYDKAAKADRDKALALSVLVINRQCAVKVMVLPGRFELPTSPLPRECSTPELRQRCVLRVLIVALFWHYKPKLGGAYHFTSRLTMALVRFENNRSVKKLPAIRFEASP